MKISDSNERYTDLCLTSCGFLSYRLTIVWMRMKREIKYIKLKSVQNQKAKSVARKVAEGENESVA